MKWVSSFYYLPIPYGIPLATVADQTQQVSFVNNLRGSKIRLRFSNRYSSHPLVLDKVKVNNRAVTLHGETTVRLAPFEEQWSDELDCSVAPGDKIVVSTYIKDAQVIESACIFWSRKGALVKLSTSGDYTDGGDFATCNAQEMQDVFSTEAVDTVLLLEGINDIMHPVQFGHLDEQVRAEELEQGYKRLIEIAHSHNARIFAATIPPCGSPAYPADWLAQFEHTRLDLNDRIRSGIGFDGFFDYDAAVRDPHHPGYLKADCHIGDGLHPNDKGGAVMADIIDLQQLLGGYTDAKR